MDGREDRGSMKEIIGVSKDSTPPLRNQLNIHSAINFNHFAGHVARSFAE